MIGDKFRRKKSRSSFVVDPAVIMTIDLFRQPHRHDSRRSGERLRIRSLCHRLVLGVGFWLAAGSIGWSAPPTLTNLFPAGGQRGSKVVVTCTGTWTWPPKISSPGIDAVPTADAGKLEVSIPADLAADRVWIRFYDAEGASVLQPFLIGGWHEIEEVEPNEKPQQAQVVAEAAVTVNGALKEADVDCFSVTLAAGQTLVAALDANTRLGSPMDSILQVVSPDGIILAENHDDLNLDPRLAFTAAKAGTYIVRLFAFPSTPNTTIRFHGGAGHIYRLTLTTGPYATHAIPLSASLAQPDSVGVAGWNIPPETRLNIVPFGGSRLADLQELEPLEELRRSPETRLGYALSADGTISTRIRQTPLTVVLKSETADSATPMTVPVSSSVTGRLKARRQQDEYLIPLMKGQQVVISVEARSLDVPLDPVMKLADPTGTVVADVDDIGSLRDALIVHTAAHDGDYRLTVSDRFRQGGDRCWYLLTVRLDQPDFDLSANADAIVTTSDKPAELTVKVQRRGTAANPVGPLTIQAVSLPDAVTCAAVVSETTGPTATEVKLTFTSTGAPFSGPVRITGKASSPAEIERAVRTPAHLGVTFETIWLTVVGKLAAEPPK